MTVLRYRDDLTILAREPENFRSDAARQWAGYGTALKPAWEPICLARKPLDGTNVENVLKWGVGGLNIDGCRVGTEDDLRAGAAKLWSHYREGEASADRRYTGNGGTNFAMTLGPRGGDAKGRFPANILHDGSDEVLAAFPDTQATGKRSEASKARWAEAESTMPGSGGTNRKNTEYAGDSGSAARFFYSAKADADDRLGSKHPTVKPVDLMQWLVRLVTPKGGLVLDPFAGTGTTGEAAWREGMNAVLIEREPEYQADIARRMALCVAGPDERVRASNKAKHGDLPAGPLFDFTPARTEP